MYGLISYEAVSDNSRTKSFIIISIQSDALLDNYFKIALLNESMQEICSGHFNIIVMTNCHEWDNGESMHLILI